MSKAARAKWTTAASKIEKTAGDLVQLIANATDRSPTEATIKRKIKSCVDAFDKFEEVHSTYLDLDEDGEAAAKTFYNAVHDEFEKGVGPAVERLEAMNEVDTDDRFRQKIASLERSADNKTALTDKNVQ